MEFPIEMAGHLYNRAAATAQPVILEKFLLYILPVCQEAPNLRICMKFLHLESSRGRNHLFQILCQLVEGFRICKVSNFAIFL